MKRNSSHNIFGLNNNVIGILWMVSAGLFFSCMVGLVKVLGNRIPSYEIVFFRSAIQILVIAIVVCRTGLASLKTNRPVLQGLRVVIAILLINCNFYAFTKLPVAEVTAIGFSRNLFLAILAVPFLSEKLTAHKLAALLIGFIGIIIITRPEQGALNPVMIIALAGTVLGAIMMIMIRKLTATDSNLVMMTYPALGVVLATSIPTYIFWIQPLAQEFFIILLMSLVGIIGQWCMIQAFRSGEATAIAPAGYTRIIFATIVGYSFFGEIPAILSLLGIVIIVCSNLFLIFHEAKNGDNEN